MSDNSKKQVALRDCTAEEWCKACNSMMRKLKQEAERSFGSQCAWHQHWALRDLRWEVKSLAKERMARKDTPQ